MSLHSPHTVATGELRPTVEPVVDAGGEFSRERGGSESIREPNGVPDRDSSDGVGEPTDILTNHPHTTSESEVCAFKLASRISSFFLVKFSGVLIQNFTIGE